MVAYVRVCLLLLSTVIALTTEGLPVSRRMMPSPPWKNKPTTLLYPHRKFSRPWLIKMQEELWKEGSSGDGPDDDIKSSILSSAKYKPSYESKTAYKTHSPSSEDFISGDEETFPTVIDTIIEESPDYGGELISRTSMPYEGPSSLLNSFIFRPSVPFISSSSIQTPFIEESVESQYAYPSWLDKSSSWTMSTRQAVSDKYSDQMVIVTAVSATHIYSEIEWTFPTNLIPLTDPSKTYSNPPISLITEITSSSIKTANHTEVPSFTTVQMLPLHSNKGQFYLTTDNEILPISYHSDYFHSFKEFHQSSIKSQIFLSSSNVSVRPTQTNFYSEKLSMTQDVSFLTLHNYSNNFNEELFSYRTPFVSPYHTVSVSTELSSEKVQANSLVTNSYFQIDSEILYSGNNSLYNKTLFQDTLSSNIQTTLTVVENKIDSNRFVMPTLTIRGTPISVDAYTDNFHDAAFSTSNPEGTLNFPVITSSFTDVEDNIPVISLWPLDISSVENIISQEDTKTFIQELSYSDKTPKYQFISERKNAADYTTFHSIFSNPPFPDNETPFNKSSSYSEFPELKINSTQTNSLETLSLIRTYIPSIEQTLTTFLYSTVMSDIHSWVNEIETEDMKINISSWLQPNISLTENSTTNASQTTSSVLNSDDLSFQLLSTRALTYVNNKSQQEMASTLASVLQILSSNDGASLEKEPRPTQHSSGEEFIDPSTHHVTVRSLRDDSAFESGDSLLESYTKSTESNTENIFATTHISTAVEINFASSENITLEEKLRSLIYTDSKFSSTDLKSTFPLFENPNITAINSTPSDNFISHINEFDKSMTTFAPSKNLSSDYFSLTDNEYIKSTSLLPIYLSPSPLYYTSMNHEEPRSQSFSRDSLILSTELLPETLNPSDFIDDKISDSFLKTIPSASRESSYFEDTKKFEDSHTLSPVSSTNNLSKFGDTFSLIYANRTVNLNNEQSSEQLKNTIDFGSSIKPSKTVPQFENDSKVDEITTIYSVTENGYASNKMESTNAYLETSGNFEGTQIESSMISLHFSDAPEPKYSQDIFISISNVEDVAMLETPYLETSFLTETLMYSLSSYPNLREDSEKHDLSRHYDGNLDQMHNNSYLLTLVVPWEVSKHILEYSLPSKATENDISGYKESLASGSYVTSDLHFQDISSYSKTGLPSSEVISFKTYDQSYEIKKDIADTSFSFVSGERSLSKEFISFYNIESSSNSYLLSSSPLFATSFITEISSPSISSTILIDSSFSFMELKSPSLGDTLETEIYPSEWDSFGDFPAFAFTGKSKLFLSTPVITPLEPTDVYKESSCLVSFCQIFLEKTFTPDSVISIADYSYVSLKPEPISSSFIDSEQSIKNYSFILNSNLTIQEDLKTVERFHSKTTDPKSVKSDYSTIKIETASAASEILVIKTGSVSTEYDYSVRKPDPGSIDSDYQIRKNESKTAESDYQIKETGPESIDSTQPIRRTESEYRTRKPVPQSAESDYSTRNPEVQSIQSDYSTERPEPHSIESDYSTERPEPHSIESEFPLRKPDPQSIQSDYFTKKTDQSIESDYFTRKPESLSIHSDYSTKKPEPHSIESEFPIRKPDPKSVQSDYFTKQTDQSIESEYFTRKPEPQSIHSGYSTKKPEPHSIESEFPIRKPDPKSIQSDYFTKKTDPKSVESGYPQFSIHVTKSIITNIAVTSLQPISYVSLSPTKVSFLDTNQKESTMELTTPGTSDTDLSRKWLKESATAGYDVEIASVLAISSFFGTNSSRTAGSAFEDSGISESDSSKTEVSPTPSLDLTLFKDDLYWILSVLEAPVKGHLPENFSHTMETRLANAYSEAFRRRDGKKGPYGPEDKVVVKILSLTNDLLLSQLNIVYVVERGGTLVPASVASEYLNFLRHEQLREFLGLYAILKAKPYRPSELAESHPVPSPIPVVTIVCSILGFLLLVFCCLCVYCRCCRPKQAADTSPTSSASGSLQRSLEKHGQHNRKHLFREMTHQLTTELVSRKKQPESAAPDIYMPAEKELPPGKKLPPLPLTVQAETLDKAMKMLKILENKDASTSPIVRKHSGSTDRSDETDGKAQEMKRMPKPKKRRKTKEVQEKSYEEKASEANADGKRPVHPPSKGQGQGEMSLPSEMHRKSPDSGTSSRHTSSTLTSTSEKLTEEGGSDGSHTELLPPLQDLIAKSKADSEAAAADTQIHLSRVRQRISELLDDAFALAGGRKFYGSLRSKRIEPATDVFPRYASLRSQSAAECSQARYEENNSADEHQRPISEGGQHLLGTITDDGQLITKPPPKQVWDPDLQNTMPDENRPQEVTEAHNRHINFFPFQQQSKLRQISASSSSSLPVLDTLHESHVDIKASTSSTTDVMREAASEVYLAHSSKIHPAAIDQYDEIDVVSALREGEPVAALIQAIKDELQRFSGSLPGTNNESSA